MDPRHEKLDHYVVWIYIIILELLIDKDKD